MSLIVLVGIIVLAYVVLSFFIGRSEYSGAAAITSLLSNIGPSGMLGGLVTIIAIVAVLSFCAGCI